VVFVIGIVDSSDKVQYRVLVSTSVIVVVAVVVYARVLVTGTPKTPVCSNRATNKGAISIIAIGIHLFKVNSHLHRDTLYV
jgi:NADH:ubiquinone oxidoreductase subunit 6 (subunit J)